MTRTLMALSGVLLLAIAGCGQQSGVMDEIDRQEKISGEEAERLMAESIKYLDANKQKPGVTVTESGLQYEVVRSADESGPTPGPMDTVTVHYEGTLPNGTVFDSSYARAEPTSFQVGGVIDGWTEALQLMRPGEEYRLVLPPEIAYGPGGSPPDIPPNQVLIFKVELLGFRRPDGSVVGTVQ